MKTTVSTLLVLSLGATLGATLRYYVSNWAANFFGSTFPYGTLIVNVVGSFLLGWFLTLAVGKLEFSPMVRLFVATGFCGSLTTFSTFGYETIILFKGGSYMVATLNIIISLVLGGISIVLGMATAHVMIP